MNTKTETKRRPGRPPRDGVARTATERSREHREARAKQLAAMGLKTELLIASAESMEAVTELAREINHHPGVLLARLCGEVLSDASIYQAWDTETRSEKFKSGRFEIVQRVIKELRELPNTAPFLELVTGVRP